MTDDAERLAGIEARAELAKDAPYPQGWAYLKESANDVPSLLDLVRRLREERDQLRRERDAANDDEHVATARAEKAERERDRLIERPEATGKRTWSCKIGELHGEPYGADSPMREAVEVAYRELTGEAPTFIFSGWAAGLTENERAVVENREPRI